MNRRLKQRPNDVVQLVHRHRTPPRPLRAKMNHTTAHTTSLRAIQPSKTPLSAASWWNRVRRRRGGGLRETRRNTPLREHLRFLSEGHRPLSVRSVARRRLPSLLSSTGTRSARCVRRFVGAAASFLGGSNAVPTQPPPFAGHCALFSYLGMLFSWRLLSFSNVSTFSGCFVSIQRNWYQKAGYRWESVTSIAVSLGLIHSADILLMDFETMTNLFLFFSGLDYLTTRYFLLSLYELYSH